MIHKTHVLLKQYGERGIILTKRNLSLSMKIVLLLLSSAILAILCYAFFRNNVTDFYTFIETVEKPFNEKMFIKGFKEEAKNISIYSKDKNDKKELKKLASVLSPDPSDTEGPPPDRTTTRSSWACHSFPNGSPSAGKTPRGRRDSTQH